MESSSVSWENKFHKYKAGKLHGKVKERVRGMGCDETIQFNSPLQKEHHVEMKSCCSPIRAASPCNALLESVSPHCYLLQVLCAALILVYIQVHKADLGERAKEAVK